MYERDENVIEKLENRQIFLSIPFVVSRDGCGNVLGRISNFDIPFEMILPALARLYAICIQFPIELITHNIRHFKVLLKKRFTKKKKKKERGRGKIKKSTRVIVKPIDVYRYTNPRSVKYLKICDFHTASLIISPLTTMQYTGHNTKFKIPIKYAITRGHVSILYNVLYAILITVFAFNEIFSTLDSGREHSIIIRVPVQPFGIKVQKKKNHQKIVRTTVESR